MTDPEDEDKEASWLFLSSGDGVPAESDPSPEAAKALLDEALNQTAKVGPPIGGVEFIESVAEDFPQLDILDILGKGGMGAVFRARQRSLNRNVALKVILPKVENHAAFKDRFVREAQALARLSHPNIVAVYDFGEVRDRYFLIMEYIDGLNLRELIRANQIDSNQALSLVSQICDALQYAHAEGVVHRDIKPENILVTKNGRVKIADFGLAKLLGPGSEDVSLTAAGDVMGTMYYMAPEQLEHPKTVDHRADIYALGVVFYELLTGELPIGHFAPPSQKVEIDVRLDEVVLRAMQREPEKRYQQASDVKSDVDHISSTPGQHSIPVPSDERKAIFKSVLANVPDQAEEQQLLVTSRSSAEQTASAAVSPPITTLESSGTSQRSHLWLAIGGVGFGILGIGMWLHSITNRTLPVQQAVVPGIAQSELNSITVAKAGETKLVTGPNRTASVHQPVVIGVPQPTPAVFSKSTADVTTVARSNRPRSVHQPVVFGVPQPTPAIFSKNTADVTTGAKSNHPDGVQKGVVFAVPQPTQNPAAGKSDDETDTAAGPNLIANGGFEKDTQGWTVFANDGDVISTRSQAHSGSASGYISGRMNAEGGMCLELDKLLSKRGVYRLTCWAKAENAEETDLNIQLRKDESDGGTNPSDTSSTTTVTLAKGDINNREWERFDLFFPVFMDKDIQMLRLWWNLPDNGANMFLDDVRLVKLDDRCSTAALFSLTGAKSPPQDLPTGYFGRNMITNGSFEAGLDGWGISEQGACTISASSALVHSGSQSCHITNQLRREKGPETMIFETFPVGGYYLLKSKVRLQKALPATVITYLNLDGPNLAIGKVASKLTVSDQAWANAHNTFTMSNPVDGFRARLIWQCSDLDKDYFIDDIELQLISIFNSGYRYPVVKPKS